jgi:hypothetical protein
MTGNIAIQSLDGRYMKVTASNGLAFGDQNLDDRAKFTVKPGSNNKVQLVGRRFCAYVGLRALIPNRSHLQWEIRQHVSFLRDNFLGETDFL